MSDTNPIPAPPPRAHMAAAIHDVSPDNLEVTVGAAYAWLRLGPANLYPHVDDGADLVAQLEALAEVGVAIARAAEVQRDVLLAERLERSAAARVDAEAVPA